jgi:hypothetical protein
LAAFVLAGCANAAGAGAGVSIAVFLIALLGLGVAACTDDSSAKDGGGWHVGDDVSTDASDTSDTADAEGTWESCCEGGQISTCYCPPRTACNYGMYYDCGDGTCTYDPEMCVDDAGHTEDADITEDAGHTEDADITEDADAAPIEDVSDTADATDTGDVDADADGHWSACCLNGEVDSCFCPSGVACNYGWFTDCGDGTCVMPGEECPHDADAGS